MTSDKRHLGWKATLAVCSLILLSAGGIIVLIFSTEPVAVRGAATKETAMLVETIETMRGKFHPTIVAVGTVRPARDVILRARVAGTIVERSPAFVPGGLVDGESVLVRIDPADYEIAVEQRKSDLRRAVADLKVEMGRQNVAKKDFQLLEQSLSADIENKDLILRKPQLDTARAGVQAARAALRQAELELQRTTVTAPFDAHILSRSVDIGSQVSAGDELARMVGLDTYWVEATVAQSKLRWLSFPEGAGNAGSAVRIRNRSAWPESVYRTGRLYKLIGALDGRTRMARVLITVADPLARHTGTATLPPLMVGAFVEAQIRAKEIADVVRLDRKYVRKDDTVWVMEKGRLAIRKVDIALQDAQYAYVSAGLGGGEQVVTTHLSTVVDGARLRLKETRSSTGPDAPAAVSDDRARRGTPAGGGR